VLTQLCFHIKQIKNGNSLAHKKTEVEECEMICAGGYLTVAPQTRHKQQENVPEVGSINTVQPTFQSWPLPFVGSKANSSEGLILQPGSQN